MDESRYPFRQRLDKWLWCARFFRSRSQASRFCADGRLRINDARTEKAHHPVRAGDVLTFALGTRVWVVRIMTLAARRGPAAEARTLYDDLSPAPTTAAVAAPPVAVRGPGSGRPTKAERRAIDRLRSG